MIKFAVPFVVTPQEYADLNEIKNSGFTVWSYYSDFGQRKDR